MIVVMACDGVLFALEVQVMVRMVIDVVPHIRALSNCFHVRWRQVTDAIRAQHIMNVTTVVLCVHLPIRLEITARCHLEPPNAAGVARKGGDVEELAA